MKYQETCQCCGHKQTAYVTNLTKGLVGCLKKIVDYYDLYKQPAKLNDDLHLTINQYGNFYKLAYWDFVRNFKSKWVPTQRAIDFIYGEKCVENKLIAFNKRVLPFLHPAWKEIEMKLVFIKDIDEDCYKRREEYQAEKSGQYSLI